MVFDASEDGLRPSLLDSTSKDLKRPPISSKKKRGDLVAHEGKWITPEQYKIEKAKAPTLDTRIATDIGRGPANPSSYQAKLDKETVQRAAEIDAKMLVDLRHNSKIAEMYDQQKEKDRVIAEKIEWQRQKDAVQAQVDYDMMMNM